MALTREDILRGGRKAREARIEALGDVVQYRPLSAGATIRFMEQREQAQAAKEDGAGAGSLIRLMAELVVEHLVAEDGSPLLAKEDAEALPQDAVKEISSMLLGIERKDLEVPEGNGSSEAAPSASPTDSPST